MFLGVRITKKFIRTLKNHRWDLGENLGHEKDYTIVMWKKTCFIG